MFGEIPKKARRRKGRRHMKFADKAAHIIHMMDQNAEFLTDLRGVQGWGFTMSQIADMTAYQRSTALMNDLYKMCDTGLLQPHERINPSNGLSPFTVYFYTLDEYKRAVKQKRLFE